MSNLFADFEDYLGLYRNEINTLKQQLAQKDQFIQTLQAENKKLKEEKKVD